jgi:putative ABC transport system permease protein
LTVSGSAVALFVFCFVAAVHEGMDNLLRHTSAARSLITFQANKFCPATSHLPQDYAREIAALDGVRQVVPVQVFTNNCRASLDVVVFHGMPPAKLREVRGIQFVSGSWPEFSLHQDSALLGRAVADRRGVRAGEKFSIGGLTVHVAGIFRGQDPSEENYVYTHLDFLQRREGRNLTGTVTQFEILLDAGVDAAAKCEEIDAKFRHGAVQTNTRPKGVFQHSSLGDLAPLIGMTRYLGFACLGLVFALVSTTTLMSVQDRRKEHAVLQTIGFSGTQVFCMIVAESTLLGLAGGLLGVVLAVVALAFGNLSVGAEAVTLAFTPSLHLVLVGTAVSLVTGVVAGIAPAAYAIRVEIVPALRQP